MRDFRLRDGFNGTTAQRPWNETTLRSRLAPVHGFNGATAERPWNEEETPATPPIDPASMEPR